MLMGTYKAEISLVADPRNVNVIIILLHLIVYMYMNNIAHLFMVLKVLGSE